jgi:hypothetical protein
MGNKSVVRLLGVIDWSSPVFDLSAGAAHAAGTAARWVAKVISGLHPSIPRS